MVPALHHGRLIVPMASPRASRKVGAACLALGLIANEWWIGTALSADGTIDAPLFRGLLAVFDLTLIALGIWGLSGRPYPATRTWGFAGITVLLCLLLMEFGLRGIRRLAGSSPPDVHLASRLSIYGGESWAHELFDELNADILRHRFVADPFRGWRMVEYEGKWTHANPEGVRATWAPPGRVNSTAAKLWIFGGSTTWGFGARDDQTLPSWVSRLAHKQGRPLQVTNYGTLAYTLMQEIAHLVQLLKQGERPDLVVFYDGVNDVYASYARGTPGSVIDVLGTLETRRELTPLQQVRTGFLRFAQDHSALYQSVTILAAKGSPRPPVSETGAGWDEAALLDLAHGIAEHHMECLHLVEQLARAYDFDFLSFWQPVTFTETTLHPEEQTDPRVSDEGLGLLHRQVRDRLQELAPDRLHDVSMALESRSDPVYLDYCHVSEDGNRLLAEIIWESIKDRDSLKNTP